MENKAMERKLHNGEALDVGTVGTALEHFEGNVWVLHKFMEDVDYCDAASEQWIWSIGKDKVSGTIYAAVDGRFYQNPKFECLWLR